MDYKSNIQNFKYFILLILALKINSKNLPALEIIIKSSPKTYIPTRIMLFLEENAELDLLESSIFAEKIGSVEEKVVKAACVSSNVRPYFSLLLIRQSWPLLLA